MTEESVETLYLLGKEHLIVGVSAYVERPAQAQKLPKISAFTHANIKKILSLKPDLVLGFSDIQKDIARELIGLGVNVFISNQRSLDEILDYILLLGSIVGAQERARKLILKLQKKRIRACAKAMQLKRRPRVYLEEWDDPMICGIRWFSQLVEECGAIDICGKWSQESLGKDRIVDKDFVARANPDIILGCWCGKKVDRDAFAKRPGWKSLNAIKESDVYELDPAIFLQPGPAPFLEGLDILGQLFWQWSRKAD